MIDILCNFNFLLMKSSIYFFIELIKITKSNYLLFFSKNKQLLTALNLNPKISVNLMVD